MNEFSQISRMIRTLQLLSTRKSLTTTDLLDYFDHSISRRTLQRDMLALSNSGVPLVNEKITANENIWYLMDHFKQFIPVPLEMNEYLALEMLRANLTVFKNTSIEEDVEKLTKKIEQILPEDIFLQSSVSESTDIFTNYAMGEYDYSDKNDIINSLINAITNKRKCLATYDSPTAKKESKFYIEPEKLLTYHGGLYVIFYARGQNEFWLLAVHRLIDLTVLDEEFEDDHPFDETEFLKHRFGLFGGKAEKIKLKFDKSIRHYIEHKHWHPTQKITPDKKGNITLEMETAITPELTSWIMSWHKNVKVMKPNKLRNQVIKNIEKINKLYNLS